jgi:hypothetical protein
MTLLNPVWVKEFKKQLAPVHITESTAEQG